jgi:hypothetical protein
METQLFWMVGKDFFFSTHKLGRERNDTRIFFLRSKHTNRERTKSLGCSNRAPSPERQHITRFHPPLSLSSRRALPREPVTLDRPSAVAAAWRWRAPSRAVTPRDGSGAAAGSSVGVGRGAARGDGAVPPPQTVLWRPLGGPHWPLRCRYVGAFECLCRSPSRFCRVLWF